MSRNGAVQGKLKSDKRKKGKGKLKFVHQHFQNRNHNNASQGMREGSAKKSAVRREIIKSGVPAVKACFRGE